MKKKISEKKKEKRQNLLEAASLLFSQKDIHSVTISDIAQKANVAKGTFYLYFKDKYEIQDVLIMQACNRLLNHARQKLNQNDIQNFEDAVIFIIDSIFNSQYFQSPEVAHAVSRNRFTCFILFMKCHVFCLLFSCCFL